jgi:hypothetical protein
MKIRVTDSDSILALQEPPGAMVVGGATDLDLRPGTGI